MTLLDGGLLALRNVLGLVFFVHGVDKLRDPESARLLFESLSIPAPSVTAPFVSIVEAAGGAMLALGLLTPLAGVALAIDMAVALYTAHRHNGFFVEQGGYELVLVLGVASLALAATGPGRVSLDAVLGVPPRRGP
jgi:putative oxidoreductase